MTPEDRPRDYPPVLGEFHTLVLLAAGKSIARFGDGELKLMHGKEYFREPASAELAAELRQIIRSPHPDCLVGIPTMDPRGPKYQNWLRHAERFARALDPEVNYASAFITRPDSAPWINTLEFAVAIEKLWRGKRVVVLSEPTNSILKAARLAAAHTLHVPCPSREAYAQIDRLQAELLSFSAEVALLSCGPTATCLANRLAAAGLQAIDIGSAGGYLLKLLTRRS